MQANLVIDVEQLRKNVQSLPPAVSDILVQRGLLDAARATAKYAKTPGFAFDDRTGAARKSIRASPARRNVRLKGGGRKTILYVALKIGKAGAKHGSLLEVGTEHAKARAPLRKALDATLSTSWRKAVDGMQRAYGQMEAKLKDGTISKTYLRAALKGSNVSGKQKYWNKGNVGEGFF